MMIDTIVRVQQIELMNFKNVKHGMISFPNSKHADVLNRKAEIIGIYGQNGSGKTALVEAMWIIKHVLKGESLPEESWDYISNTSMSSEMKIVFDMEHRNQKYQVFYRFQMSKDDTERARITEENLSYKKYFDGKWSNKANIIDYDTNNRMTVFTPIKNYKILTKSNPDNTVGLNVSKRLSEKDCTSFIFSNETQDIFRGVDDFKEYADIISTLTFFSKVNLIVITNKNTGVINTNRLLPFNFRLNYRKRITHGNLGIGLSDRTIVPEQVYEIIKEIIQQMNMVLETIIPGLNIDIRNHGVQPMEDGLNGIEVDLVSVREGAIIPLKYESDGIKKVVSILSALIAMYNSPTVCMVVDELDSGIFEFLLGEILQIINESGKGQLVFTSHNLRPLEMLDNSSLVFTTTNANNRYIKMENIKNNNNLRSVYYRSISLGGQKEDIYQETNRYEINHAFRLAGRAIDDN